MNTLIVSDDNYIEYYKVLFKSIVYNNTDVEIICYLLYSTGLCAEKLEEFSSYCNHNKITLYPIRINKDCFENAPCEEWSIETYFRLLVIDSLPKKVDRILYLDGDMVVLKNIEEFYKSDFGNTFFIGCEDRSISGGKNLEEYHRMGIPEDEVYINAGVLLINLIELRKEIKQSDILDYLYQKMDIIKYADQSVINGMFYNKFKIADAFLYNCMVNTYSYTLKKKILKEAFIIHYAGSGQRPWNVECGRRFATAVPGDLWWKYQRMLEGSFNKKYLWWKLQNTLYVKPWQIVYRLFRMIRPKGAEK